ncbi:hypothetical protein [Streptomyces malaysiensis]|uniref:Uncharacterized protein n=1 Tax=Streptomyces malaysiensis subsp. samsunensis TaxID=459658 RepID=A0A9X2RV18_STRMQ|nr:hypothetical protein [Streptomyces samsunensis]MCQ8831837.1 hypothetical protein [Streptomyces samsunensis]
MNFPAQTQPANHIGQATAIELSRAEAEVKAAVFVAKQNPRNRQAAQEEMRFACNQLAIAEKAFFSYPKAGQTVSGPSVHLARELALIWGNLQHGTMELSRDTALGQSEILAYAWDLERNSRSSQIFIAPHVRDTRSGKKNLTDLRDVYENNANLGARRLREAIYAVLPDYYTAEAIQICQQTLAKGDGASLDDRIEQEVSRYERVGVSVKQLETKVGRPRQKWDEQDVAKLGTIFRSVERGEMSRDEAFPPERITAAEIQGQRQQQGAQTEEPTSWPETAQPGSAA